MRTDAQQEKMLAVVINWSVFALFGGGLVLNGFAQNSLAMGIGGYSLLVLGFVSHVILNSLFRTEFASGEIVLGTIAFGIALACFVGASIFGSSMSQQEFLVGILGFASIIVAFAAYLVTRYGLKNSFSMFHVNGKR